VKNESVKESFNGISSGIEMRKEQNEHGSSGSSRMEANNGGGDTYITAS
jgi:hypothetical protein